MDESRDSVVLGGVELRRMESYWMDRESPDGRRPREFWSAKSGDRSFHLEREGKAWRVGVYGPGGLGMEVRQCVGDRDVDAVAGELFSRHAG